MWAAAAVVLASHIALGHWRIIRPSDRRSSLSRNDRIFDPLDEIRHFGVNAKFPFLSATLAERGNPEHRPSPGGGVLAEQRPSWKYTMILVISNTHVPHCVSNSHD